jgi:V8-like Glu-specific endopeptidase
MSKLFALTIAILSSYQAFALPLPKGNLSTLQVPASMTSNYDFEGIVALDNCSGSLVRFENSRETDHAMVMTNGHCLEFGFSGPGVVVTHKPSVRSFRVLDSQSNNLGRITATEVIYSTMTKTDLTLYQTVETYAQIADKFHVRPMTLSSQHPEVSQKIEVISGYWKKGYSCAVEAFVPSLKEEEWTFVDSIRYSRPGCETIGGTSGSPIVLAGTRTVIGINNTGNEDGEKCTMNNPCEVSDEGQITYEKGLSYGQETYWIYSCLNDKNQLDLKIAGCALPK